MKFVRLGSSLALLMAGVACTQSPQNTTGPSAVSQTVVAATAADGSTLKVSPPGTVSPVDGQRAEDRRPTLVWTNAEGKYAGVGVAYDIELSTPERVVYEMTVGESPNFGAHIIPFDIDYDTVYSWRIRARVGDMLGPWSSWASFLSPTRPVVVAAPSGGASPLGGCAAPVSPLGPGETRKPRPNDSRIVQQVASAFPAAFAHSCQEHYGAAGWEFMDRVIDALRAHDGRYGYNAKRGNMNDPSQDVASYYYGADPGAFQGSSSVYIFDLIAGHCGSTPSTFWGDVTDITNSSGTIGRTMYPRPGRVVDTSACAK